MLLIYLLKFDIDAMAQDSDIVDQARLCIPCPPNLVCMGNANPPVAIDRIGFGNTKNNTLMYGILPVAAPSTQWWVECPNTQNKRAYSRGHSIGLSSCFHVAERWTAQESRLSNKLFSFSFPAILMVESSNTSIITGIVNLEQQIYSKHIFANIHKTPTMEFIHTTPAEGTWFVMMEMDMTEVLPLFTDILSQKQEQILMTLDAIDQETGAAFSTLLPLLWAIACTNHTDASLAVPVFVVPGIVQNSVTEKIVVRAVTQIMQILDVRGSPPQHVFQLNSQQVLLSVSKAHTTSRPLLFVHNNICDADNNPDEDYETCRKKFPGNPSIVLHNKHDGAQKTDANVDDPALLPSVGSKRARRAPPKSSTPQPPSLLPNPGTAHGSFLLSHIMIPLSFQTADPLSSQIA